MNTTQETFGTLRNYKTGESLRPATEEERDLSRRAAEQDNGRGAFLCRPTLFARSIACYVEE